MPPFKFSGLCTATHTPFHADGSLNLGAVERQAAFLRDNGITSVFIGGTTGESSSLTAAERAALGERWAVIGPAHGIDVVVHVGANCLTEAAQLAAHAEQNGAKAVSMIAPSYFKPRTLADLVAPVDEFLEAASPAIPNLAGVKYSNPDLASMRRARLLEGGRFDLPYGIDERFLSALRAGATAGVGSTYNFNAGPLRRAIAAHARGDAATAEAEQAKVQPVVDILAARGYMGAAKALMRHLGVPLGPARLPNGNPTKEEFAALLAELEALDFFSWHR
jgi:N-acetylneuraminate lyase